MTLALAVGDRVCVRDRIWRIARATALPQAQLVLEIESVDGDAERLSVVVPPEEIEQKSLPAHRVGRLWKFKLSKIDEWVRTSGAEGSHEPEGRGEPDDREG
jgi:excisionase family DNA binding protein